ncbi:MAG: hypothetical protein ACREIV_13765, partial [Planctomycetaceae bacterium]
PTLMVTGLVLLTVGMGAVWVGLKRWNQFARIEGSRLTVSAERRDFGEVWSQPAFRWTLPIHNPTGEAVHVKQFTATCECTSVKPESLVIPPGETRNAELTLDLRPKTMHETTAAVYGFEVNVGARAGKASESWTIHGRVRRNPVAVSAQVVDFGNDLVVATSFNSRTVIVSVPESGELSDLRAECVPADAGWVHLDRLDGQPGRYRLDITPAETHGRGRFAFLIRLSARHESFSPGPTREIAVIGTVQGAIQAEPATLMFGARPVGESAVDHVLLFSHDGRPFRARAVNSSPDVQLKPVPGGRPSVQVFELRQEFAQRGDGRSSVEFEARYVDADDGAPPESVVVETSYYGLLEQTANASESSP